MNQDIGYAAGAIWRYLEQQSQPVTLSSLKRSLPLSLTLLMMGMGWLAKENKLNIEISDNSHSYSISIKR